MKWEWYFFLASMGYGARLFLGYDMIRGVRNTWHHKGWLTAAQDLMFWVSSGFYLFSRVYHWNHGIIRWYFFVGILLGMLGYGKIISPFTVKFVSFLLKRLKMLFSWVNIILERFFKVFFKILGIKNGENVKTEKETDACS